LNLFLKKDFKKDASIIEFFEKKIYRFDKYIENAIENFDNKIKLDITIAIFDNINKINLFAYSISLLNNIIRLVESKSQIIDSIN